MSRERRRWPRVALEMHVVMRFHRAEDVAEATSLNVSRHGVFLRTDHVKPIGTRVRLSLSLDSTGERLDAEGFVVHANPDPERPGEEAPAGSERGVGIYLTDVPDGWARLCEQLEAKAAGT